MRLPFFKSPIGRNQNAKEDAIIMGQAKLGDEARDRITGYSGIVICTSEWLNGCRRVVIQSQALDAGKVSDGHSFDIEQVEVVTAGKYFEKKPAQKTGGPMPEPRRQADPVR